MSLSAELQRLRIALEALRPRRPVPLLVLPGVLVARCEHDPGCDGLCPEAPGDPGGEFLLYSDGSLRPWEAA